MKNNFLALMMMIKDESTTIKKSLDSVKDIVDSVIIYDTGSTDDTLKIVYKWCTDNNITPFIKQGVFENFEKSRNILLEYAETIEKPPEYLLLLDANDEFRQSGNLLTFIKENDFTACKLQQQWQSRSITKFWNIRLIKNGCNWRYKGRVHEYISSNLPNNIILDAPLDYVIYQNRLIGCESSGERYKLDVVLLLQDYNEDPTEPRTCFYLAQTYHCLGDAQNAYKYYKLRTSLGGFYEETFHSYVILAKISVFLKHQWDDTFKWCMKAYEIIPRVEPLLMIVKYYVEKSNYHMAYLFINMAYHLEYPTKCGLFIDSDCYTYERYHLMGRISFYVNEKKLGKEACIKAIKAKNKDIDKYNLKFYNM